MPVTRHACHPARGRTSYLPVGALTAAWHEIRRSHRGLDPDPAQVAARACLQRGADATFLLAPAVHHLGEGVVPSRRRLPVSQFAAIPRVQAQNPTQPPTRRPVRSRL